MKTTTIGPFAGIDNVHIATNNVFQVPERGEQRLMNVVSATNLDFMDEGWARSRKLLSDDTTLVAGLGGWDVGGRMFFQDDSTLYERTTTDTALITGLRARAMLCEHWGKVYVTDGTNHWELDGQTVRDWGLPVPAVTLSPGTGHLEAGTYLVQVAFVDALGNEGGTSDVSSATLTTATGIVISVSNASSSVV